MEPGDLYEARLLVAVHGRRCAQLHVEEHSMKASSRQAYEKWSRVAAAIEYLPEEECWSLVWQIWLK